MTTGKETNWIYWYAAVIIALFVQIAFYLWLTRYWQ